jgi:hypothetical protein
MGNGPDSNVRILFQARPEIKRRAPPQANSGIFVKQKTDERDRNPKAAGFATEDTWDNAPWKGGRERGDRWRETLGKGFPPRVSIPLTTIIPA